AHISLALDEAALARKPFVQGLAGEDHPRLCSAVRLGSLRRFSRYSFTSRRSLVVRSSIEARMSLEAARTRNECPFVNTVASAPWLSRIDGFFSTASSSSTWTRSPSCLSSFCSFCSAYV